MLRRLWPKCVLLGMFCLVVAHLPVSQAGRVLNDALATKPFRHHVWQDVLTHWVNGRGEVDFAKLRAFPKRLNEYLEQLESVSPDSNPSYFPTRADQAAYWVNAHNAIALRIILNHYPVTSLSQVDDYETNHRYKLGGQGYTLGQIRSKAISYRKYPQILFSMTNYTLEAPALLTQAYEGKTLKAMTRQAMKATVANKQLVSYERKNPSCAYLVLSPYFYGYEQTLFVPPSYEAEDRDSIDNPIKTVSYGKWTETFRAYAPPALYADLGRSCAQDVEFKPTNLTLRQIPYQSLAPTKLEQ